MLVKLEQQSDDRSVVPFRGLEEGLLAPSVSPAMRAIASIVADIATTDIPVLLLGETGTGKEVVAVTIHHLSRRRDGRFIKILCSSLTAEDFKHLLPKSKEDHAISSLSTVFLDEIADMSAESQVRLLEAFSRLDGETERPQLGACVISATCQNLEGALQTGRFRHDLYYRLGGVCLRIPPLRQRKEDILPLAEYFLDKYSALFGRPRPQLTAAGMRVLSEHSWPGNVRELENTMKRVIALGNERAALRDLGEQLDAALTANEEQGACSLKQAARAASRQAERELILKVLSRTRWNRKRAAEELQISYKALLYKLKQIGLEEPTS
ncbi:MAG: sigma 54-interacting transcriptional regulator [Terriglobia bacterium]